MKLNKPTAKNFDSIINNRPDQGIIFRCVDCQQFMLPEELHMLTLRFRWEGESRAVPYELCPYCFEKPPAVESVDEIPKSTFITLTREQYAKTAQAEKWGLTYDPKTDKTSSNLILVSN